MKAKTVRDAESHTYSEVCCPTKFGICILKRSDLIIEPVRDERTCTGIDQSTST